MDPDRSELIAKGKDRLNKFKQKKKNPFQDEIVSVAETKTGKSSLKRVILATPAATVYKDDLIVTAGSPNLSHPRGSDESLRGEPFLEKKKVEERKIAVTNILSSGSGNVSPAATANSSNHLTTKEITSPQKFIQELPVKLESKSPQKFIQEEPLTLSPQKFIEEVSFKFESKSTIQEEPLKLSPQKLIIEVPLKLEPESSPINDVKLESVSAQNWKDKYDLIWHQFEALQKENWKEKFESSCSQLSELKNVFESRAKEFASLMNQRNSLLVENSRLETEIKEIKDQLMTIEEQLGMANERCAHLNSISKELELTKLELEGFKTELEEVKNNQDANDMIAIARNELGKAKSELSTLNEDLEIYKTMITKKDEEIMRLHSQGPIIQQKCDHEKELDELKARIQHLSSNNEQLNGLVQTLTLEKNEIVNVSSVYEKKIQSQLIELDEYQDKANGMSEAINEFIDSKDIQYFFSSVRPFLTIEMQERIAKSQSQEVDHKLPDNETLLEMTMQITGLSVERDQLLQESNKLQESIDSFEQERNEYMQMIKLLEDNCSDLMNARNQLNSTLESQKIQIAEIDQQWKLKYEKLEKSLVENGSRNEMDVEKDITLEKLTKDIETVLSEKKLLYEESQFLLRENERLSLANQELKEETDLLNKRLVRIKADQEEALALQRQRLIVEMKKEFDSEMHDHSRQLEVYHKEEIEKLLQTRADLLNEETKAVSTVNDLRVEIESLNDQMAKLKNFYEGQISNMKNHENVFAEYKAEYDNLLRKKDQEIVKLNEKIENLTCDFDNVKAEIETKIQSHQAKFESSFSNEGRLNNMVSELQTNLDQQIALNNDLKNQIHEKSVKLEQQISLAIDLEERLKRSSETYVETLKKYEQSNSMISQLQQSLNQMTSHSENLMNQAREKHADEIREYQSKLTQVEEHFKERRESTNGRLNKLEHNLKSTVAELQKLNDLNQQLEHQLKLSNEKEQDLTLELKNSQSANLAAQNELERQVRVLMQQLEERTDQMQKAIAARDIQIKQFKAIKSENLKGIEAIKADYEMNLEKIKNLLEENNKKLLEKVQMLEKEKRQLEQNNSDIGRGHDKEIKLLEAEVEEKAQMVRVLERRLVDLEECKSNMAASLKEETNREVNSLLELKNTEIRTMQEKIQVLTKDNEIGSSLIQDYKSSIESLNQEVNELKLKLNNEQEDHYNQRNELVVAIKNGHKTIQELQGLISVAEEHHLKTIEKLKKDSVREMEYWKHQFNGTIENITNEKHQAEKSLMEENDRLLKKINELEIGSEEREKATQTKMYAKESLIESLRSQLRSRESEINNFGSAVLIIKNMKNELVEIRDLYTILMRQTDFDLKNLKKPLNSIISFFSGISSIQISPLIDQSIVNIDSLAVILKQYLDLTEKLEQERFLHETNNHKLVSELEACNSKTVRLDFELNKIKFSKDKTEADLTDSIQKLEHMEIILANKDHEIVLLTQQLKKAKEEHNLSTSPMLMDTTILAEDSIMESRMEDLLERNDAKHSNFQKGSSELVEKLRKDNDALRKDIEKYIQSQLSTNQLVDRLHQEIDSLKKGTGTPMQKNQNGMDSVYDRQSSLLEHFENLYNTSEAQKDVLRSTLESYLKGDHQLEQLRDVWIKEVEGNEALRSTLVELKLYHDEVERELKNDVVTLANEIQRISTLDNQSEWKQREALWQTEKVALLSLVDNLSNSLQDKLITISDKFVEKLALIEEKYHSIKTKVKVNFLAEKTLPQGNFSEIKTTKEEFDHNECKETLNKLQVEIKEKSKKLIQNQKDLEQLRLQFDSISAENVFKSKQIQSMQIVLKQKEDIYLALFKKEQEWGQKYSELEHSRFLDGQKMKQDMEIVRQEIRRKEQEMTQKYEELAQSVNASDKGAEWKIYQENLNVKHSIEVTTLKNRYKTEIKKFQNQFTLLANEIRYLKAKYHRETGFRADLIYQKKFLVLLVGGHGACDEATDQLIHREPSKSNLQRLKGVFLMVLAVERIKWSQAREIRRRTE